MSANGKKRARLAPDKKRRRRQAILMRILVGIVLAGLLVGLFFGVRSAYRRIRGWVDSVMNDPLLESSSVAETTSHVPVETTTVLSADDETVRYAEVLAEASRIAAYYDYDGAIACLQNEKDYARSDLLQKTVQDYLRIKTTLVKTDITKICQLYFRSLIVDPEMAFKSREKDNYNQTMTTVEEFRRILEQLYENGYVLIRLHDMAYTDASGRFVQGAVMLPEGKKPLVLSFDDVSYTDSMKRDGFASRVVLDENGDPACEYINRNGSTSVGEFDAIPILEHFVQEHPDFSYKGARGILALTGYQGVLGYRTGTLYGNPEDPDYKLAYAQINVADERALAYRVINRLKELGWEFASQTWGLINMKKADTERIERDLKRWQDEVGSLLDGGSDILIFPYGLDFGSWRSYSGDDAVCVLLKSMGYRYFCPVDSYNIPWVQFNSGEGYLRQGRVNLDGYALYYRREKLAQFIDAASVFDEARPVPVPEY